MLFSISWFKVTVNERCEVGTTPALSGKPPNPPPSSGLWRRENWLSILFSETQFAKIHLHEETKSVENRLRRITNIYISNIPLKKKKKRRERPLAIKIDKRLKKKSFRGNKRLKALQIAWNDVEDTMASVLGLQNPEFWTAGILEPILLDNHFICLWHLQPSSIQTHADGCVPDRRPSAPASLGLEHARL